MWDDLWLRALDNCIGDSPPPPSSSPEASTINLEWCCWWWCWCWWWWWKRWLLQPLSLPTATSPYIQVWYEKVVLSRNWEPRFSQRTRSKKNYHPIWGRRSTCQNSFDSNDLASQSTVKMLSITDTLRLIWKWTPFQWSLNHSRSVTPQPRAVLAWFRAWLVGYRKPFSQHRQWKMAPGPFRI